MFQTKPVLSSILAAGVLLCAPSALASPAAPGNPNQDPQTPGNFSVKGSVMTEKAATIPAGKANSMAITKGVTVSGVFNAVGDNPHVSNGQISAHGWWEIVSGISPTQQANVTITLTGRSAGNLLNSVISSKTANSSQTLLAGSGGSGRRVTAKYTCSNLIQKSYWYSSVRAVLIGQTATTPVATGPVQTFYCGT